MTKLGHKVQGKGWNCKIEVENPDQTRKGDGKEKRRKKVGERLWAEKGGERCVVGRTRRPEPEKAVTSSLSMVGSWCCCFFILLIFLLTLPTVFFSPCLCFFPHPPPVPSQKLLLPPCREEQLLLLPSWTLDLERSHVHCRAHHAEPVCAFSSLSCTPPSGSTLRSRTWHQGQLQASTMVSAHLLALGLPWAG